MKPQRILLIFLFGIILTSKTAVSATDLEKIYVKEYHPNGTLKAEGWQIGTHKIDYWKFYHANGELASKGHFRKNKKHGYWYFYGNSGKTRKEGHYIHGSAENWWIFYDIANACTSKFQYKNNQKNGYGLRYKKRKLVKAEKYTNDKKQGEWTSVIAFKRDNPGVSLR